MNPAPVRSRHPSLTCSNTSLLSWLFPSRPLPPVGWGLNTNPVRPRSVCNQPPACQHLPAPPPAQAPPALPKSPLESRKNERRRGGKDSWDQHRDSEPAVIPLLFLRHQSHPLHIPTIIIITTLTTGLLTITITASLRKRCRQRARGQDSPPPRCKRNLRRASLSASCSNPKNLRGKETERGIVIERET